MSVMHSDAFHTSAADSVSIGTDLFFFFNFSAGSS